MTKNARAAVFLRFITKVFLSKVLDPTPGVPRSEVRVQSHGEIGRPKRMKVDGHKIEQSLKWTFERRC